MQVLNLLLHGSIPFADAVHATPQSTFVLAMKKLAAHAFVGHVEIAAYFR